MSKPWTRWTWKQRVAHALLMIVVTAAAVLLMVATDGVGRLLVQLVYVVVMVPGIYVLYSATVAADQRHEEGDETAQSPAFRRSLERREQRAAKRRE